MAKFLFGLLTLLLGGGVGLAAATGAMRAKLYYLNRKRNDLDCAIVRAGLAITHGILVIRVFQNSVVEQSPWTWSYALGSLIIVAGLVRAVKTDVEALASEEVKHANSE